MKINHFVGTLAGIGMSIMVHIAKVSIHMLIFSYRWLGHDFFGSTTQQVVSMRIEEHLYTKFSTLEGKGYRSCKPQDCL